MADDEGWRHRPGDNGADGRARFGLALGAASAALAAFFHDAAHRLLIVSAWLGLPLDPGAWGILCRLARGICAALAGVLAARGRAIATLVWRRRPAFPGVCRLGKGCGGQAKDPEE